MLLLFSENERLHHIISESEIAIEALNSKFEFL